MISTNIINNDQSGSHKPFKGGGSLPYLEQFVWFTPITIGDLLRYCWIRFLMIFFTVSMMLSLEFQCAFKIFFLFVFFLISHPFLL